MHKVDSSGATVANEFTDGEPGVTPATVIAAKWLNSVQRELIAIVNAGGLTPSDADDAQILAALSTIVSNNANTLKPGLILPYAGLSAPTGFLLPDGSAISRSNYAALFSAITADKGTFTVTIASPGLFTRISHGLQTGDRVAITTTGALPTGLAENTNYFVIYSNDDTFWLAASYSDAIAGTKINTSGTQNGVHSLLYCPYGISGSTNFLLPNTIGAFLRGSGLSTLYTHNARIIQGANVNDISQGHFHNIYNYTGGGGTIVSVNSTGSAPVTSATSVTQVREPINDGTNGTPRTGAETAPKYLGVNFIIKY